jgi:hypothetical protein
MNSWLGEGYLCFLVQDTAGGRTTVGELSANLLVSSIYFYAQTLSISILSLEQEGCLEDFSGGGAVNRLKPSRVVHRFPNLLGWGVEGTTVVSTGSLHADVVSPSAVKLATIGKSSWGEVDANLSRLSLRDKDQSGG